MSLSSSSLSWGSLQEWTDMALAQNHSSNIELKIYSWALHIFQTKEGKGALVLLQTIISFPSAGMTEVLA